MKKEKKKICLISSSGGHFEQLLMLRKLNEKFDICCKNSEIGLLNIITITNIVKDQCCNNMHNLSSNILTKFIIVCINFISPNLYIIT